MTRKQKVTSDQYLKGLILALAEEIQELRRQIDTLNQKRVAKLTSNIDNEIAKRQTQLKELQNNITKLEAKRQKILATPVNGEEDEQLHQLNTALQQKLELLGRLNSTAETHPTDSASMPIARKSNGIAVTVDKKGYQPPAQIMLEFRSEFGGNDSELSPIMLGVARRAYPNPEAKLSGVPLGPGNIEAGRNVHEDASRGKGGFHYQQFDKVLASMQALIDSGTVTAGQTWWDALRTCELIQTVKSNGDTSCYFNTERWNKVVVPRVNMWLENPK